MISKLNFHDENKLMLKMLDKAHELNLEADYFISISKRKNL